MQLVHFPTSWKPEEPLNFSIFSGDIELEHYRKMAEGFINRYFLVLDLFGIRKQDLPGYHHNGFVATRALGHIMYG